jgi:hypothetical protein
MQASSVRPLCYVLRAESGQIIGSLTLASRAVEVAGVTVRAGQTIDLVISPEHRTLGPAVQLHRTLIEMLPRLGLAFAFSFPTRQAEAVLKRVGYTSPGAVERWVLPLSYGAPVRNWATQRIGKRAASILGHGVDLGRAMVLAPYLRRGTSAYATVLDPPFDERFDDLWNRAKVQFDFVGDRSAEYLAWRFGRYPGRVYQTFAVVNARDTILGYVVFARREDRVVIADLLAESSQQCEALLKQFIRETRRMGVDFISFKHFGSQEIRQLLTVCGFHARGRDTDFFLYKNGSDAASAPLNGVSRAHVTEADRDA